MGALKDSGEDNHCSSGGECLRYDKPQYAVTLLRTKLRLNVLEVDFHEKDVKKQAGLQEKADTCDESECEALQMADLLQSLKPIV